MIQALLRSVPAQASEYGFSVYGLGYGIPMSGYTPPPGVYFSDTFYLYSGSAASNVNFPFGRVTAIGITANLITNIAAVAWYTDVKLLGGTLGFAAAFLSAPIRIPRLYHLSAPWELIASSRMKPKPPDDAKPRLARAVIALMAFATTSIFASPSAGPLLQIRTRVKIRLAIKIPPRSLIARTTALMSRALRTHSNCALPTRPPQTIRAKQMTSKCSCS